MIILYISWINVLKLGDYVWYTKNNVLYIILSFPTSSHTGLFFFFVDDIIYRILQQPQRTRINVLEIEEEEVIVEPVIEEPETIEVIETEPEVVDTSGALPETAAADPEPDENQEEEENVWKRTCSNGS